MVRFFSFLLFFTTPVLAQPTQNLIILTTFSESALNPIVKQFKHQHPKSEIRVIARREESGLRLLQQDNHDIDIIISSSPTFFQPLINSQKLLPFSNAKIRKTRKQLSHNIFSFGHTGFGLLWNKNYLSKNNLAIPSRLKDLIKPDYYRHISISSPYRSDTTHLMIENILQQYGWVEGWRLLYQIGGNLASVETSTFSLSEAISRGLIGIGPVVDSYARTYKKQFSFVDFSYQPQSPLLPHYVAMVKNTHHSQFARDFVNLLLSQECQTKATIDEQLANSNGIDRDEFIKNTFSVESLDYNVIQQRSGLVKHLFEQTISSQLPQLNQVWQLLHSIESASSKLTKQQYTDFLHAKHLASTSPIGIDDLKNKIYHELPLFRDNPQVDSYRQQWRGKMAAQLEQAIALSQKIINGNPALQ
ncbi:MULTISPECIES: ABC transporter substrate-binding protein [unclassified Photobacterium]|uniref:ABC transporter substrate-binding protein n=1 Tax=unclassified Photobacterium TaxID=2628852 RepID=UPI001EDD13CD|nr:MULTISPECIES: ABC transporter substrate-binding protein [unclassified Photobacterium]MCG3863226.1 ABC transporter substrate-binding protein [Photobacterium sp. Ph6]MCG3874756.1 ABC transporter substrate-binding protein [Photobacterium sp. Ph5]